MTERIWFCKVGGDAGELPEGCDSPMREAIARAYQEITGRDPEFIFSGWAAQLTEGERAVVENREPRPEFWCEHCKQSTVPPERCISSGCQKAAAGRSALCQEHYDALPPALRGEKAIAAPVVERPPLRFVCPVCDYAVDACVCGASAENGSEAP